MNAPPVHAALALPAFTRDIKAEFHFRRSGASSKATKLALILEELGVLRATPPFGSANELVEQALGAWADKHTGPLEVFGGIALSVGLDSVRDWLQHCQYTGADVDRDVDPDQSILICLTPWDLANMYVLERKCTAIEARHPGLAQTALYHLHIAMWRTLYSFSPAVAFDWCDNFGIWDDTEEAEEHGILSRAQFDAAIPTWVSRPGRVLTRTAIEAMRHPVAARTLALIDALADRRALGAPSPGHWHSAVGCALCWKAGDPVGAVTDDALRDACESGEAIEEFTAHVVDLERRAVAEWLDGAGRMLHTIGCVDRLIQLLGEKDR